MEETPAHRLDEALLTCEMDGKDGQEHRAVTPCLLLPLAPDLSRGFPRRLTALPRVQEQQPHQAAHERLHGVGEGREEEDFAGLPGHA